MKRFGKFLLFLLIFAFLGVMSLGIYKFNFLHDDVFIKGNNMQRADAHYFIGEWLEPVPGMEGKYQGFKLNPDFSASSINMNTLIYKKWNVKDGKLILESESIGNGQSLISREEYIIESVGKYKLFLNYYGDVKSFTRR